MPLKVEHVNPESMHRNPAFSQAVSVEGPARTIYVGGQNGVDSEGNVVGDDVGTQTKAALENLQTVLVEAGADLKDVVSWSILLVEGQPLAPGFAAFQEVWGDRGETPAITFAQVAGLANPAYLVELTATAVVPA
jgi:enamine deaminase RidA (YjgF/YER057c/UK114 family)